MKKTDEIGEFEEDEFEEEEDKDLIEALEEEESD